MQEGNVRHSSAKHRFPFPLVLGCLLLMSLAASITFGQAGSSARLTGQVLDQTGAVMAHVQLDLEDTATGVHRSTVSNDAGYFSLDVLPPGRYRLTAKAPGFSATIISPIDLLVNQTVNMSVSMKPGEITQQITVDASSVALETQTSSLGSVVEEKTVKQLPLLLRDPTQLVTLVAGVTADHRFEGGGTELGGVSYQGRLSFEINGGFRSQAISMVDGVDITISAGSFLSAPVNPTADFTQEFKVQTTNVPAEFGRGAGVLNIVTKSGTNSFHGSAFEFLQNDNLNANNFFANRDGQKLPELKRNQFGFTFGGPVIKDKTFFFVNGEWLRQQRFLLIDTSVPTEQQRNGDFSGLYTVAGNPVTIYNPFDTYKDTDGRIKRRAFPNNQIPASLLNSFAQNVMAYYPSPNNPGRLGPGGEYTGVSNFVLGAGAKANFDRLDFKGDHTIKTNHHLMGRYSRSYYDTGSVNAFNNVATSTALSNRNNVQPGHNAVLSWTWTPSPTMVITQSANWARIVDDSDSFSRGFDLKQLGGPFANGKIQNYANSFTGGSAFPNIVPTGFAQLGDGFGQNFAEPFSNYQYSIGIMKTKNKHTFRAGFQGILLQSADNLNKGFGGTFNFTGQFSCGPDPLVCSPFTGNGAADMLLGTLGGGNMNAGFSSLYSGKYLAWYFQDDFRVTPKLTLNLGLRYDLNTPFTERHNHEYEFDPNRPSPIGSVVGPNTGGVDLNTYFSNLSGKPLTGAVVFPTSPGVAGRGIVPMDKTNWSPRLGFAYQATNKLVIRGGYSKLYMLSPLAPGPSTPGNGPFGASTNITGSINGIDPNVSINDPFPNGFNVPIYDTQGLNSLLGDRVWGGATKGKTPYQHQFNIGLQYELPGSTILSAAYAGTRGRRLTCAFFYCGDQIPRDLVQKYGSKLLDTVPNPFFGIITDPLVPLSAPQVQLGQLLKAWPQYSGVVPILPAYQGLDENGDSFKSSYNALQVEVSKRYSHGLTVQAAYTWSKNLTNTDSFESGYLGPAVGYQDNYNYAGERSLSASDVKHRLSVGYVYDLPFGRTRALGKSWAKPVDTVIGNWQLAGVTIFASGYPLGVSQTGHTTGAFGGGDRPDLVGNPCYDNGPGRSRNDKINGWLNPAGFARNADFTFGDAPRTLSCRGDGIKNTDLSLIKFFRFTERFSAEFRSEFFNIFNRTRLGAPNTTFGSGGFGTISNTLNYPRVIQFGLKVNF